MATGCTLPPLEFQGQNRKLVTTFFGGTLTALGYVIDTRRGGATLHLPSKTSQVLSIRTGHATSLGVSALAGGLSRKALRAPDSPGGHCSRSTTAGFTSMARRAGT
jgi:hypothetical protein